MHDDHLRSFMATEQIVGLFESEEELLSATRAAREAGFTVHDVYTPYAVHGLDEAMGLGRSRLSVVCFVCGLAGLSGGLLFQLWVSAVDWPMNIGGKSYTAVPALIPIAFELTILLAAIGTVVAFFAGARLWPGQTEAVIDPSITDDRFAVALVCKGRTQEELSRFLRERGAADIRLRSAGP